MSSQNIAIVIPCRNEEHYIEKCLYSILNQTYPSDKIKIYVVDGFSTDKTREKVAALMNSHSNIFLIDNIKKTTPFALNIGIKNAKNAEFIMILGAHAELYSDYLQKAVDIFKQNADISCLGGILENISDNKTTEAISFAMSSFFGVGSAHFRTGIKDGFVDTVAFGIYKKEVFDKVGLFDEELIRNQDDEFNFRLKKNNLKIFLSRDLRAKYYVRSGFFKLFRQYFQYGYWKVYVNRKHNSITTLRQLVPFAFVCFLALFGILSIFSSFIFWIFISVLAFYFFT
ncbi:MAG: glycosyltransferase family 2 protein, partial [Bacteroidales bacterium]